MSVGTETVSRTKHIARFTQSDNSKPFSILNISTLSFFCDSSISNSHCLSLGIARAISQASVSLPRSKQSSRAASKLLYSDVWLKFRVHSTGIVDPRIKSWKPVVSIVRILDQIYKL